MRLSSYRYNGYLTHPDDDKEINMVRGWLNTGSGFLSFLVGPTRFDVSRKAIPRELFGLCTINLWPALILALLNDHDEKWRTHTLAWLEKMR